jgi:hypothetical protein
MWGFAGIHVRTVLVSSGLQIGQYSLPQHGVRMGANPLEINEVNELIRAVDQRVESLVLDLAKLDEFNNAEAYRALETQIRDLKDQQHMLNKRWSELTAGFSER